MTSVELQMPLEDGSMQTICDKGVVWFTNYQLVYELPQSVPTNTFFFPLQSNDNGRISLGESRDNRVRANGIATDDDH